MRLAFLSFSLTMAQTSSPMSKTLVENDLILWNNSIHNLNPTEAPASPWLFDYEMSTLLVLHLPNPTEIHLSQLTLIFCALLDIHDSYWSSDSPHLANIKQRTHLSLYHNLLRSQVEMDLLNQNLENPEKVRMPEMMSPWVDRTIFLYPHDNIGREAWEEHVYSVSSKKLEGRINFSLTLNSDHLLIPSGPQGIAVAQCPGSYWFYDQASTT
jgi:hypothetical protein